MFSYEALTDEQNTLVSTQIPVQVDVYIVNMFINNVFFVSSAHAQCYGTHVISNEPGVLLLLIH